MLNYKKCTLSLCIEILENERWANFRNFEYQSSDELLGVFLVQYLLAGLEWVDMDKINEEIIKTENYGKTNE